MRRAGRRYKSIPLPPGPKGLPIIGNPQAVQPGKRPGDYRWERFLQWSRDYDSPDAVSVEVFGGRMIVLNSKKAVTELLEKRSANYSDRPAMRMNVELSGWYWNFAHMRYSDRWRFHRKTFHQYFQPRVMPEYYEIQRVATARLIRKLLASPEDFEGHLKEHSGSIILEIVYGYTLQATNDPYLLLVSKALPGIVETSVPGSFLVDFLPILKFVPSWFPGAGFKRKAKSWKKYSEELRDLPWGWLMESITQGAVEPSFVTRNLERLSSSMENDKREAMEEVIRNCAGISFLAGSDTTVTALLSFILNMARHPEIQSRAQSEVDSLGRLPDFADKEKLPFVDAVIAEALRCDPVAPLAVPHAVMEDDVYEGMRIPKGSTVVGNTWAILHDGEVYPDPMTFNPDRFMKKDGNEELPPHPEMFAFGFGRRICPGRYLALTSMWIAVAHILATFTITRDGEEEVVTYHDALVRFSSKSVQVQVHTTIKVWFEECK
ncbi:cytochrome P450 [Marasmius fiardii PR-910]|nr:cytochrome P450 [Marasmius fiardii PR-910]